MWDQLNEASAQRQIPPWHPPSSHPSDSAYTVASPPPTSPRKPWEGTLRELSGQQQVIRGSSPQRHRSQDHAARSQQEDVHPQRTPPPVCGQGCMSQPPQHSPQSPAPAPIACISPVPQSSPQHADKAVPVQQWEPHRIDRAISAQEWEGFGIAAELNGQDEVRANGLGGVTVFEPARHRGGTDNSPLDKPHYLRLPEAESYESFKVLACAFRHWRSHAKNERLDRYIAALWLHAAFDQATSGEEAARVPMSH